jgi:hypothetical protein
VKQIKVSDDLHERLKELAEKKGVSIADVVEEALNVYLGGSASGKTIKRVVDRELPASYQGKCDKCGKPINPGEYIRFILYEYEDGSKSKMVLCSDCALSLNPSLWRIVKKKRELEVVIKQMKAEIDRLSKQIDILELAVAVKNYFDIILKTRGSSEESRRLIEVLEKLEDIAERLRVLESSVKVKAKVARRPYQYARGR